MKISELSKKLHSYLSWGDEKSWEEEVISIKIPFGGHTGSYDLDYTPYFKQILEDLDDEDLEMIGIMCPAQIGKTVFLLIIGNLWAIKYAVPVYFVVPNITTGIELMTNKVIPLVLENKKFKSMLEKDSTTGNISRKSMKQNTINYVNGGSFNIINAGGRQSLKGKTTSLVIIDEYAECVKSSPRALGDMLERAYSRISQFTGHNRKILLASTPTLTNEDIHGYSQTAKNYKYHHTCIHCSASNEIVFSDIRLENHLKNEDVSIQRKAIENKESIIYTCPECGSVYYDYEKRDMMTRCQWVKIEDNEEADLRKKCYSFQGTYSHRPWREILLQYLGAKLSSTKFRAFKNDVLAEPYSLETITTKLDSNIFKKSLYPRTIADENIINIATGIDVQTKSQEIFVTICGWHVDKKIRIIDWMKLVYNDFQDLEDIVKTLHNKTYNNIKNSYTFIDTGSMTKERELYAICRKLGKKCIPVKGTATNYQKSMCVRNSGVDKPLLVQSDLTNMELDNFITDGEILFPCDYNDPEFTEHIQNERPSQNPNRKIKYIDKGPHDYRDALRYVVFGGDYYSLHKKQSSGGILTARR